MTATYTLETATADDDELIAEHYLVLWDSYGFARDQHVPGSEKLVRRFIDEARATQELRAFVCRSGGAAVASAACQVRRAPYPEVLLPTIRKIGYVGSVYVAPDHRRKGIAGKLMRACTGYLADIGCTSVILHASEAGLPLYKALGFEGTSELRLTLRPDP